MNEAGLVLEDGSNTRERQEVDSHSTARETYEEKS